MAIKLKTTRVRPNTGVQWRSELPEDLATTYYNTAYVETEKAVDISSSETNLQKIIVRQFNNVADKDAFIAEFSNTSSPLYARTQYNTSNGITVTHEIV